MNEKLASFIYDLEKSPKIVSFLLKSGLVVSGKFATPKPPSIYIASEWKYEGIVLLTSVTVAQLGQPFAKLPQICFEKEKITAWALGRVTAIIPNRED